MLSVADAHLAKILLPASSTKTCMETCFTMSPSSSPTVASSNWYGGHGEELPASLVTPFTKLLLVRPKSHS